MAVFRNPTEVETCFSEMEALEHGLERMKEALCLMIERGDWGSTPVHDRGNHRASQWYKAQRGKTANAKVGV